MPEYICCRSCDSPSCKGCNIYTLSTMLNKGRFDSLMNDNRSINPTADVAEVKHGEWIKTDKGQKCSSCNCLSSLADANLKSVYCPWCGADMRGGNNA